MTLTRCVKCTMLKGWATSPLAPRKLACSADVSAASATARSLLTRFPPPPQVLQILGLGHDATEQEINKAYRKLARTYHPDMPTGDVDLFQKLKKAHDALTDPVVKENFRLYGNPDGRQAMEVSIGLPNFLKGGSGWLLVLTYVGVLVVLVPVLLCWFHRQNKDIDSGTGLHRATLFWLQNRLLSWPEGTRATLMPEIIAGCREFDLKEQPPKEEVQRWAELQAAAKAQGLPTAVTPADTQKQRNLQVISPEVATRNMLVLLHHCNRRRMPVKLTPDLILAQLAMLKSTPRICDYLVDLCCRIELETLVAALRGQNVPERAYFEHAKAVLEFQQWVRNEKRRRGFVCALLCAWTATDWGECGMLGLWCRLAAVVSTLAAQCEPCEASAWQPGGSQCRSMPPSASPSPLHAFTQPCTHPHLPLPLPACRRRKGCGRATDPCASCSHRRRLTRCSPRPTRADTSPPRSPSSSPTPPRSARSWPRCPTLSALRLSV